MPYLYAHALHGYMTERRQSEALRAMLARNFDAYTLGLYGPDVYFGDTLPKPLLRKNQRFLAGELHGMDAYVLFSGLLPLAAPDDAAFAYALGFLCHAVLDSNMHPYICALYDGNDHTRFEMRQDLIIRDRGDDPRVKKPPLALFHTDGAVKTADSLHTALIAALYAGGAIKRPGLAGAFRGSYPKWQRLHRLAYDPSGRKLRVIRPFERALGKDGMLTGFLFTYDPEETRDLFNEARTPFAPPWDSADVRTETYFERFALAVDEAVPIIAAAYAGREAGDFSKALSLLGHRRMSGPPVTERT